jgi:hypothetical protein
MPAGASRTGGGGAHPHSRRKAIMVTRAEWLLSAGSGRSNILSRSFPQGVQTECKITVCRKTNYEITIPYNGCNGSGAWLSVQAVSWLAARRPGAGQANTRGLRAYREEAFRLLPARPVNRWRIHNTPAGGNRTKGAVPFKLSASRPRASASRFPRGECRCPQGLLIGK